MWSQLVRMYLKGKRKLSHLLELEIIKDDRKFSGWDEEDSHMVSHL